MGQTNGSQIDYQEYFKNYTCPKCKGRSCVTSEVSLDSLPKKLLLPGKSEKFLLVTCTLCGYTEMYNLNVWVSSKEPEAAHETSPVT